MNGYILLQREKEYILKFFLISVVISNLSKKNKKNLNLNHFRLCEELLKRLKGIPQDFFLYVGDMSDMNKLEMLPKSLLSLNEITDKTLLREDVVYCISK